MATVELLADAEIDRTSAEYLAAEELVRIFRREIQPDESGKVLVLSSVKCYGGKVKDFDVIVFAHFSPPLRRPIRSRAANSKTGEIEEVRNRIVEIESFCACIEVKSHDPAGVRFQGPQAHVKYGAKWHDASNQSHDQKDALRHFLGETKDIRWQPSPYIVNLLWFRGLLCGDIPSGPHNFLPSSFSLATLLEQIAAQALPLHLTFKTERFLMKCTKSSYDEADAHLRKALNYFAHVSKSVGKLTRQKLEKITRTALLKDQKYAQSIGERLVVVRGRAGTGKTIKLLHIAHDLATRHDKRCLILTYNRALVSDIRRLVTLAGVDAGIGPNAVAVDTVHSFLLRLMDGLGVEKAEFDNLPFGEMYEARKNRLREYLQLNVLTTTDIGDLMISRNEEAAWDYILIDEGQDWPENERQILFSIFQSKQFVVADGIDQFVRSPNRTAWTSGVDCHLPIVSEKRSLRQKGNLVRFQDLFANEGGIDWDLLPNPDTPGGRVIICEGDYYEELHSELFTHCKDAGNSAYEMLFLVPPALVTRDPGSPPQFALATKWMTEWNIHIWDGTNSEQRLSYPTNVSEHRLFQYDSCRGLEGWAVVCLWFDEFVKYKTQTSDRAYNSQAQISLGLKSPDEEAQAFAHRWAMMPLTRAIDTLVITIRDPKSPTSLMLRRIAQQCPDFVEWRSIMPVAAPDLPVPVSTLHSNLQPLVPPTAPMAAPTPVLPPPLSNRKHNDQPRPGSAVPTPVLPSPLSNRKLNDQPIPESAVPTPVLPPPLSNRKHKDQPLPRLGLPTPGLPLPSSNRKRNDQPMLQRVRSSRSVPDVSTEKATPDTALSADRRRED